MKVMDMVFVIGFFRKGYKVIFSCPRLAVFYMKYFYVCTLEHDVVNKIEFAGSQEELLEGFSIFILRSDTEEKRKSPGWRNRMHEKYPQRIACIQ